MPRIYICGPIRNQPEGNKAAFAKAAAEWRLHGWEVVTPWEIEDQPGWAHEHGAHRMHCLRDISSLAICDAIATLTGWHKSIGAKAELACANWMKIPNFSAEHPFNAPKLPDHIEERQS